MPKNQEEPKQVNLFLEGEHPPQLWQIEDFLKKHQDDFNIKEISRVPIKEVSQSFGQQKETIEFDIVMLSDGRTFKANVTVTKDPDDDNDEPPGTAFSLDLSGVRNAEEAKEVLDNFHEMTAQYMLERPGNAGKPLNVYSSGGGRWKEIATQSLEESLLNHADEFKAQGVLYIAHNNKILVDFRPELDATSSAAKRDPKPWDVPRVPRGAPKPGEK